MPTTRAVSTQPTTRRVASRPTTRPAGQPNILLICTDDEAAGLAGFEGGKVKTPNLDRLAAQSINFARCYVPTPQRAPTRASIVTGQYPHTHGVIYDGLALRKSSDTITTRLKNAGYACGFVGQWELGQPKDEALGFGLTDFTATNDAPATAEAWANVDVKINGTAGKSEKFLTEWQADQAIQCIEQFQDRPFFLWLSFTAPHEPFAYPPNMENAYPPAGVDLPKIFQPNVSAWPSKLQQITPFQRFRQLNDHTIREARSRYEAMLAHLDAQIGRVLQQLDELKLSGETWVIFTSDSGFAFGENTLFGKGPAFIEPMVHVPMLVRGPALAARKSERVVSLVDLAPTWCELTNLTVPAAMQGRSLLGILNNERAVWSDEVFLEYHKHTAPECPAEMEAKMRGIIVQHFKLIDYLDDTDMFFDLKRDPDETLNAVGAPQYIGVAKVLFQRLLQWRRETHDPVPIQ